MKLSQYKANLSSQKAPETHLSIPKASSNAD